MANPNGVPKNLIPWKPGVSPNPGGKPVNSRNSITKKFLEVLAKDFDKNGESAIVQMRETDPSSYVRAVASLLPKEFIIERPLDGLSDDELSAAIADLRARISAIDGVGERVGEEEIREPSANLLPI